MNLSKSRCAATIDLIVVLVVFLGGFIAISGLSAIVKYRQGLSVLLIATFQFFLEGAAPLVLMALRHESFSSYGLTTRRLGASLWVGLVLAVLYDLAFSCTHRAFFWIPFGGHGVMRRALSVGFPSSVLGVALVLLSWGFMESFFGVYFARKVHLVLGHPGYGWFAPGVLAFALFNGVIHAMIGQGLEGFLTSFASGYAITVVPAITKNAWGGIFVQTLTNAIGKLR